MNRLLGLILMLTFPFAAAAQDHGLLAAKGTCVDGTPRIFMAVDSTNAYDTTTGNSTFDSFLVCRDGRWEGISFTGPGRSFSAPDNGDVSMFTVSLPTQDTGCFVHISYSLFGTNGTDTFVHAGIALYAITNDDGVVSGSASLTDEVINGTGCNAGCDSNMSSVASTTYTGKLRFNNTLSVTGTLSVRLLNTTCGSGLTIL